MPEEINGRTHLYHAEASILSGFLRLPLVRQIDSQARIALPKEGGYISQRAAAFQLESVISFRSGYTQVAGNRSTKPGQGWTTLTTTAVEGLNVLDVVTADRIVGQTITEHPAVGYVPRVNFLGTHFDNLRIAGHPVKLDLDLNILGSKPASDGTYAQDSGVISRASDQCRRVLENRNLPEELRERYNRLSSSLGNPGGVECSVVNLATGAFPGHSFGHVIDVPDFGKIVLGKVTVTHEDFDTPTGAPRKTTVRLTMIDFQLGCAVDGDVSLDDGSTNGGTIP